MEHIHGDDEDQEDHELLDPELVAGWRALEAGDAQAARRAAEAVLARRAAQEKEDSGSPSDAADPSHLDALLLTAACFRQEDDAQSALDSLKAAAKEDSEWCTPELWTAEVLAEDPDRLDEALRHARRALDLAEEEDDYLDALRCKASVELDLGRPTEARKTLSGLPPADLPLDDVDASLDFAQLLLDVGDPAEARRRLQTLVGAEPELADAFYLLGLAAELMNDEEAKRAAWIKTRALDLEEPRGGHGAGFGPDAGAAERGEGNLHLSEDTLVGLAEAALTEMPEDLRAMMANVPIVVAEMPAAADVANGLDPRLLGLFSGTPQGESAGVLDPPQLTEIVLFRRNLERFAVDEEMLRDEVRTTLLHEAGHFFGLDEAALVRLGLE